MTYTQGGCHLDAKNFSHLVKDRLLRGHAFQGEVLQSDHMNHLTWP